MDIPPNFYKKKSKGRWSNRRRSSARVSSVRYWQRLLSPHFGSFVIWRPDQGKRGFAKVLTRLMPAWFTLLLAFHYRFAPCSSPIPCYISACIIMETMLCCVLHIKEGGVRGPLEIVDKSQFTGFPVWKFLYCVWFWFFCPNYARGVFYVHHLIDI